MTSAEMSDNEEKSEKGSERCHKWRGNLLEIYNKDQKNPSIVITENFPVSSWKFEVCSCPESFSLMHRRFGAEAVATPASCTTCPPLLAPDQTLHKLLYCVCLCPLKTFNLHSKKGCFTLCTSTKNKLTTSANSSLYCIFVTGGAFILFLVYSHWPLYFPE